LGRADVYLQPEAADPVLADALILGLAHRHVRTATAVTTVDESGGEARVYIVDGAVVVKTQRPHRLRPRTSLAKEAYLLDLLAPVLDGRIPRLLGYDRVDTDQGPVEYLCITRMPGVAIRYRGIPAEARRDVLRDLAGVLRTLHAAEADHAQMPTDADSAALRRRLELSFGDIADAFAGRDLSALPVPLEEVTERVLSSVPAQLGGAPVPLHSNPGPPHVFVDPATGRLTGLIDFGDAYASHPVLDLHRFPDPDDRVRLREAYLAGEPTDPGFDLMWTVAMIYSDLAAIAEGSSHAADATKDLAVRLDSL
jgi:aminoglycoside phosphotransferase (APT) family kinase protein